MTDDPAADLRALFGEAAEIEDDAAREDYLQARCGHDPDLLQRLRGMLSVREEADALFERPTGRDSGDTVRNADMLPGLGRVGRFRLERLVGRGGMGTVFLAHDEQLQRPVALKFPRLETMGNPELLERFLREARLAAQLDHPNLVEIYEVGVWGQACFIASQWCEGGDLLEWLTIHPGPQPPIWSARLVYSVARALAYCHEQGVVHLDIKPANIILAPDGDCGDAGADSSAEGDAGPVKPMLTDFGVARVIEEGLTVTHTSLLLGTPLYMAPEQVDCRRDKIGPRSDVFAMGVVLHELLYGRRPFDGASAIEVLDKIRSADTLAISAAPAVPQDLRTICQRCLEREPARRYRSADALADDLDRYLRGEPIHARPVSPLRRLGRWLERPERIVQAGIASLIIQSVILADFAVVLVVVLMGGGAVIGMSPWDFTRHTLLLTLFHSPAVAAAWMSMRGRRWGPPAGLLMNLIIGAVLVRGLLTGDSHIPLFQGQPLAAYLMYFFVLCATGIQIAAYLAAIPAALRPPDK